MDLDRTLALLWPRDRWPSDQNPDASVPAERLPAGNRHDRRFVRSDGALPRSSDRHHHDAGSASERNAAVSWVFVSYTFGYRNLARRMP